MTTTDKIAALHVIKIEAVEGCNCPPDRPWYRCRCADAMVTTYHVLPMNWRDVINEGEPIEDLPSITHTAEVIKRHPGAQIIYLGGNQKLWGGGAWGETHFELASKRAKGEG